MLAVCLLDELDDEAIVEHHVNGRRVAVVRSGDDVYAFRPLCPHRGAPLRFAKILGQLEGEPGAIRVLERGRVISCPWHGWEFELGSGRNVANPQGACVRMYDCAIVDGEVMVSWPERET